MCRTCLEEAISQLRISLGVKGYDDNICSGGDGVASRARRPRTVPSSRVHGQGLRHIKNAAIHTCRRALPLADGEFPPYTLWTHCQSKAPSTPLFKRGSTVTDVSVEDQVDSCVAGPIKRPTMAYKVCILIPASILRIYFVVQVAEAL